MKIFYSNCLIAALYEENELLCYIENIVRILVICWAFSELYHYYMDFGDVGDSQLNSFQEFL